MTDLRARERNDPEQDDPAVDLIEEGRVVGIVYPDEGATFAEFYSDDEGQPWAFDTGDLQRALDTAVAILGAGDEDPDPGASGIDPVEALAMEFDPLAAHRGPEDEGFYPPATVSRLLARCADLGLAIVYLEGVDLTREEVTPVAGHRVDLEEANQGQPWSLFQAECNTQARALLEKWPRRPGFAISVEVQDRSGERFVL